MRQELIVAYFADRTVGWSHVNGKSIFQGDKEWADHAQRTSFNREFISLYDGRVGGIASLDNPNDLRAVFLALAALPGERIRIAVAPAGMLESMGLDIREVGLDDEDEENDDYVSEEPEVEPVDPAGFSTEKFLTGALKIV